jgi:outer membrane protein assembly factor BamB
MHRTNRWLLAALAALLSATAAQAQIVRTNVYSRPEVPSAEALKRLNLNLAWKGYVPVDSRRDGLIRVELDGPDLFVMTRAGQIIRMDAETGKVHWRARVGRPFTIMPFLAHNDRSVYAIANVMLFSLNRANGEKRWDYRLPAGVSAAPVVDNQQIYVPASDGRVYAFTLPFVGTGEKGGGESRVYGRQRDLEFENRPRPVWSTQTNLTLTFPPLQTNETLLVVSRDAKAVGLDKVLRERETSTDLYSLSTEGSITVPGGQYGDSAYVGTDEGTVYAININTGKLRWRHVAGTAILRRPASVQKDVFVTSDREGMARVDSATGETQWKIPCGRRVATTQREADEFLACNDRFVYATDRAGRMLILDRKRGVRLSWLDTTAYRVKVVNEVTDRIYLAANDGLIICLHDRDVKEPLRHRKQFEQSRSPVNKLLDEVIKAPEGKPLALREVLFRLGQAYKLKFVVEEKAFKEALIVNVQDKLVTTPPSEDKTLRDYLQRTLNQVNATFEVANETIFIKPKPQPK